MSKKLIRKGTQKSRNAVLLYLVNTILAIIMYFIFNFQISINGHFDFSLGGYKKSERRETINSNDNFSYENGVNEHKRRKLRETYCERKC